MTVNANVATSVIHSQCAQKCNTTAMIQCTVLVANQCHVQLVTDVIRVAAWTYAKVCRVDQELHVHLENVFAHWDTLATLMIWIKGATYADNVKSIKIVKIQRFASSSAEVYEIASTLAANSSADQMHCAYQLTIDRHVFAAMVMREIQTISTWDANQSRKANVSNSQTFAKVTRIVNTDQFVRLVQTE